MAEEIELQSFRYERDDEIRSNDLLNSDNGEGRSYNKKNNKHNHLFDVGAGDSSQFFTDYNLRNNKRNEKRKPVAADITMKKQDSRRPSNLMEIIKLELSALSVTLIHNATTYVDVQDHTHILSTTKSLVPRQMQHRVTHWEGEMENGWRGNENTNSISPVFPQMIDPSVDDQNLWKKYKRPTDFNTFMNSNHAVSSSNDAEQFLIIEIQGISFKHHHSFSIEKLLCVKLVECHNAYDHIIQQINNLQKDVETFRETRNSLKSEFEKINPSKDTCLNSTIRQYTKKMLDAKSEHMKLIHAKTSIMHKIIYLWSDIKMIREKLGAEQVPISLEITKIFRNDEEYESVWINTFESEFNDMLIKVEYEYGSKCLEYKELKNNVKLAEANKKLVKPKLQIDEEELKTEAQERTNEIIVKEDIKFSLNQDITSYVESEIKNVEYHFAVYVDDVFVCKSENNLTNLNNYDMKFSELFSIQILQNNNEIELALFENSSKLVSGKMLIKDCKNNLSASDYKIMKLVSSYIVEPNMDCVGSGFSIKEIAAANKVRLKSNNVFKGKLFTQCEVNVKVHWDKRLGTKEAIVTIMQIKRNIERLQHGVESPTIDTLSEIIGCLYERNIENDIYIKSITDISQSKSTEGDSFSFDKNEQMRLKLLQLRNRGEFSGIENKLIPILTSQISTEQLRWLQQKEIEFDTNFACGNNSNMDPIELQRFISLKYLQKLNKYLIKNLDEDLTMKIYKDIVVDFEGVSLRSAERAWVAGGEQGEGGALQLTVWAGRARCLPRRYSDVAAERIAGVRICALRPYVRVECGGRGAVCRGGAARGAHPAFLYTLRLIVDVDTHRAADTLYVSVWDEDEDGGAPPRWLGEVALPLTTLRAHGELSGSFRLDTPPLLPGYRRREVSEPSPALSAPSPAASPLVELRVRAGCPPLPQLCALAARSPPPRDELAAHLGVVRSQFAREFPSRDVALSLLDSAGRFLPLCNFVHELPPPRLAAPPPPPPRSGSKSSSSSRSQRGSGDAEAEVDPGVGAGAGEGDALHTAARVAAMIPASEAPRQYTLQPHEALRVCCASGVERALVLCGWWRGAGARCLLAAGRGEGGAHHTAAAVLLCGVGWDGQWQWRVADTARGECRPLHSARPPLTHLYAVWDHTNIWLNVGPSARCERIRLELGRANLWRPVFGVGAAHPAPLPPLLPPPAECVQEEAEGVRARLETRLLAAVRRWRHRAPTVWNSYAGGVLGDALVSLERCAVRGEEALMPRALRQLLLTHQVCGAPLNLRYSSARAVEVSVKRTGAHRDVRSRAEFALAVRVYAYPHRVLSVWVFLASVTLL